MPVISCPLCHCTYETGSRCLCAYDNNPTASENIAELLVAARCAYTVLYLLEDEVKRLGCRAENVLPRLRDALRRFA